MADLTATERDLIEKLADSFVVRLRGGECPSIDEYERQYPELADELREILPALVLLEQHESLGDGEKFKRASRAAAEAPTEIGEFAIIREIGRGGMGVVYEAVQQSLGRHVALKVLTAPALLSHNHLERFHLEACAAARLHHSHIVPVFGVGEHQGLHYYAMQFIQGQSLDLVIDALRKQRYKSTRDDTALLESGRTVATAAGLLTATPADPPARALDSTSAEQLRPGLSDISITDLSHAELSASQSRREFHRSVARVGLQVAEALAYAHGEGILHRDIKPSNLLLDAKGNIWVTDFGLAKAEGTEGLTQTGDFVGTLRYMAPERLEGFSDRRSDLYGLGATLYELLTLQTLYQDSSRARMIDQILHEPPASPKKTDPSIPDDLETIIVKAMAKEPTERYRTAEQMAEDLRRFLADRPILARRATSLELLVRWRRRNPGVAALSAALVALLVATIAILAFSNARVRRESTARAVALQEQASALSTAHGAIRQMLTRTANEAFEDVPRLHRVRVGLLEDALKYYEVLASKPGADPMLRNEMAKVLHAKSGLERELDLYEDAIRSLERCIALAEPLVATDPAPPVRREELAIAERDLGLTMHYMTNPPPDNDRRVEAQYRKVLRILDDLEREWPGRPQPVTLCMRYIADFTRLRGDKVEAEQLWRSAIERGEAYAAKYPHDVNEVHEVAWASTGLFDMLSESSPGCPAECEAILQRGLRPVEKQLAVDPEAIQALDVAAALRVRLAFCSCRQNRIAEALAYFDSAVGDMERLCEEFPWNANYWSNLTWFHADMTAELLIVADTDAAHAKLRQYRDWLRSVALKLPDEPGPREKLQQNCTQLIPLLRSAGLDVDAAELAELTER